MLLLIAIILIVPKAVYDGLKIRGMHGVSGLIESLYLGVLSLVVFAWAGNYTSWIEVPDIPYWKAILGFLFVRFGIFDLVWNVSAGEKLTYIGKTKYFDRFFKWLISKGKIAIGLIWFLRLILICISVAWLLNFGQ